MTKISRRILRRDQEEKMYETLTASLAVLSSPVEVTRFLDDILSLTEKTMIGKRLWVAILLARGFTYEAIEETLKVSAPTICNVNYALRHGNEGYLSVINKIIRHEKIEAFLDGIEESLLKAFPKKFGSAAFLAKQREGREIYDRRRNRIFIK